LPSFARITGISKESLAQWERAEGLPSRALDNYLRLLRSDPHNLATLTQSAKKNNGKGRPASPPRHRKPPLAKSRAVVDG
jgi:hypothetical protein